MPSNFRLSPSGPVIAIATTSDDVENLSTVPDALTLSDALTEIASPETVTLYDDFIAGASYATTAESNGSLKIGALNWTLGITGSFNGVTRSSNGAGTLRGIVALSMPSSSASRAGLFLGSACLDPELVQSVFWRVILNGETTFSSSRRAGLGTSNAANLGPDGLYFEHSATVSGNVFAVASKAGVRTTVNTGISCPVDTYQIVELRRVGSLSWEFYVNGAFGAALSGSAIPTAVLTPAAQAQGVINTTSFIGVDTFQMTYQRRRS